MSIFRSDTEKHRENLAEEYLYGVVHNELKNGFFSPGLATMALADAGGDKEKADALYIKSRVKMLKSERAALFEQAEKTRLNAQESEKHLALEESRRLALQAQKVEQEAVVYLERVRSPGRNLTSIFLLIIGLALIPVGFVFNIGFLALGAFIGVPVGYIVLFSTWPSRRYVLRDGSKCYLNQ